MKHLEDDLQKSCVYWFRLIWPKYAKLLFAVPNGGSRNIREAARLKSQGVVSGVSDLILLVPKGNFHGLCIEMKSEKGKLSENQKEWLEMVKMQGYETSVCNSFESFCKTINEYMNLTN
jgi:hypothetical protein